MGSMPVTINGQTVQVEIIRKKMKTVRLRITPDGRIVLSAPYRVTEAWIRSFLDSKAGWIEKHYGRRSVPASDPIRDGASVCILGQPVSIRIIPAARRSVLWEGQSLVVQSPRPDDKAAVMRQLERWWRERAMEQYGDSLRRLFPLVERYGVTMPALRIRRMKTLWGSCSIGKGVITLNYDLFRAPVPCIDYIVLHELTHFLYRRHDRDFYGFLTRHMPDWKQRKRSLQRAVYP